MSTANDDRLNPKHMAGFVGNGIHVLETVRGVPKFMFEKCDAIVLISTREMAFFFTDQKGAGVALKRTGDNEWSNPIPVLLKGSGLGLSLGESEKSVLVLLGRNHADALLEAPQGVKVDFSLGFAVGKFGADSASGLAQGGKALAASTVYASSKGAFVSGEVQGCAVTQAPDVMQAFYGTPDSKQILDGTVGMPKDDGELVSKLHEAIKKYDEKQHGQK